MAKSSRKSANRKSGKKEEDTTYIIRRLDQVRALSDPLRLSILEAFAKEPRTTKQVADRLGESATKLYRHVDALRDAGLLEIKFERRKRGTVERYLQAVATRFFVERTLFDPGRSRESGDDPNQMVHVVFDTTKNEFMAAAPHATEESDLPPMAARFGGYATPQQVKRLRKKLEKWIVECQETEPPAEGGKRFGGMIVFYPLPEESGETS